MNKNRLYYRRGGDTEAVATVQGLSLRAALKIPEARAMLDELFDKETLALAGRDLVHSSNRRPSPELEKRIEKWALRCNLASQPLRDWWIYKTVLSELRRRVEPPDEDEPEVVGWSTLVSLSPPLPDLPRFEADTFDPCSQTVKEYCESVNAACQEYVSAVIENYENAGYRPSAVSGNPLHYEWLVRYQMLGHSYHEIALCVAKTASTNRISRMPKVP